MSLAVLPLAITMNAGPQIMSAIIFVTTPKALRLSAYFLIGVVSAVTLGLPVTYTLASVLGGSVSLGDPSDSGSIGNIIQYVLVGLLVILSIRSYLTRKTSEPPHWLGAMQNATPRTAFLAGLLLLSIFPSDRVILITVGVNLAQSGSNLLAAQQQTFQQQAQEQQQSFQQMTQEVMSGYAELFNIPISYAKEGLRDAQFPIEGYDDLSVDEVSARLGALSAEELRKVRDYEERTKNRETVLEQLDRRIRGGSS